jgi:hypothetical protein
VARNLNMVFILLKCFERKRKKERKKKKETKKERKKRKNEREIDYAAEHT